MDSNLIPMASYSSLIKSSTDYILNTAQACWEKLRSRRKVDERDHKVTRARRDFAASVDKITGMQQELASFQHDSLI